MKQRRPDNETNEERFKRVAEARTKAILEKLRLLGNCANKRLYDYSENDIDKIFSSIGRHLRDVKSKFNTNKHEEFKL